MRIARFLAGLAVSSMIVAGAQAGPADTARTAAWFDKHKDRPPLMRLFLQRMPKGADLHSHVSGAVYAESYLDWAAEQNYCVNLDLLTFVAPPCEEGGRQVLAGKLPASAYAAMVDRMSTRDVAYSGHSGHDQFFDTFAVFGPVSGNPKLLAPMVAELADRAASQHVLHIELMATFQGGAVHKLAEGLPWSAESDLGARYRRLQERGLADAVRAARDDLSSFDEAYRRVQGCGTASAHPGCGVSLRWLQQSTRISAPELVFAQLAFAFELAKADPRVAGLNLVAPEDNPVALRDYRLQMEMIGFLSRMSPTVKVALHAGELALGLVPPEHLRGHIRDAVAIAGARRIGHAVDIAYEEGSRETLDAMKSKGVAAEICLTSNDVILGVRGKDHPFPEYLAAGVPVVLASDDEGVSRIDLTHEYERAVRDYGIGYRQLKQLSRNGLEYSFLTGESLWRDVAHALPVAPCRSDRPGGAKVSEACRNYLERHERARLQWTLEAEFEAFEALPDWRLPAR